MKVDMKPVWFPLELYISGPKSFDHWARAIAFRLAIMRAPQSNEWKIDKYKSVVLEDDGTTWRTNDGFSNWLGIRELNAYEAFKLAEMHDLPENAEAKRVAGLRGSDAYTDESRRIKEESTGKLSDIWWDEFQYRIPVFVDLSLDDETLMYNFKFWLEIQRSAAIEGGFKPGSFKKIDEETLLEWQQKRLLAACDLMNWRELSGARYSDAAIASWLWPDSGPLSDGGDVDRAERFRKVTKPLVQRVFDWHTVNRLEHVQQTEELIAHLEAVRAKSE